MASPPLFASASFEAEEAVDEGVVVHRNDQANTNEEEREGLDNAVVINSSQHTDTSVLGEISIIKDFFVSAFSDGYYGGACCGVGDYVISSTNCAPNDCYTSAKLPTAPTDGTPQTIRGNQIGRTTSSLSQNSNTVQSNSSLDGRRSVQRRRPLAVAVGFKYAEDMHGRPVVITPGRIPRRLPVRPRDSSQSSPASQPTHATSCVKPTEDIVITQHLMMPLESDLSQSHTASPPAYQPNATEEESRMP